MLRNLFLHVLTACGLALCFGLLCLSFAVFVGSVYADTSGGGKPGTRGNPIYVQAGMGATLSYRVVSASGTNAHMIKSSAGSVLLLSAINSSASVRYLRFYNVATTPVPGTTAVAWTIQLPVGQTTINLDAEAFPFTNGIGVSITGATGDSDTTAIAASDVVVTILYQ